MSPSATRFFLLLGIAFLSFHTYLSAQGKTAIKPHLLEIPLDLKPEHLKAGEKISIVVQNSAAVACTGPGNQSVGGFTQCASQSDATLGPDRNDFWLAVPPPAGPSETYEYDFPSLESEYPCVAGATVDEMILTITINSVIFNTGGTLGCCETYFEGVFGNLYNDCPAGGPCPVIGDGIVNNGNPGTGDCAANGDNLNYDAASNQFPLGLPYTATTTCLAGQISTNASFGVDIVPSFRYEDAVANGCACPTDLIAQGVVSITYDVEVEYVFCSATLPAGCFPASFTPIAPLCETAAAVALPSTSDNGISGTWSPPSINPAGQGGNTVTSTFTVSPGQCTGGFAEMEVQVLNATVPDFAQIGPLCETASAVPLSNTSPNGVSGTWNVGSSFDPSGQGGSTTAIIFTPDAGQCAAGQTINVVVNSGIVPTFSPIAAVCETDPPVPLPGTSNNGVMGTWDVGTSFDPTGQGGSTATLTFTPDAGQCATTTTLGITVNSGTSPLFTPIGPLCETDAPVALPSTSDNGVTGTWDVGASFDPSGQGGTTATITFTPDAAQCAITETMNIMVNTAAMPSFTPIGPLCENEGPVTLPTTSDNGISGTWDVGPTFSPAGLGGTTATLTFTPDAGQCASTTTLNISVISETFPTFDPIGPLCESGSPVPLPAISLNGISGSWDIGPTFDPNGLGGFNTTITFTPMAGQCAGTTMMNIFVEPADFPTFVQIGPLCESDSPVPLPDLSQNGILGTWDEGSFFDPNGLGNSTVTITFTPDAGECAEMETMTIVVNESTVPVFAPIGPLCEGDAPVALPAISQNGISGTWDAGSTFDPTGVGGNNVVITFTPDAGQCAAQEDMTIMVSAETAATFSPIGPFCENDAPFTLPTTSLEGITGDWDVGVSFDPSGQGGMNIPITFTPDMGQCAADIMLSVTVNALPQINIINVECVISISSYFVNFETDGDVVSSTAGTVNDGGSGIFSINDIPEGTDITVTVTNSSTNCISTFNVNSPICACPTIAPPTGNDVEICDGEAIPTLSVTADMGLQVDWYDAATGGALLAQNSTTFTPTAEGTYFAETVEPGSGCTSNSRAPIELIILPPNITFATAASCLPAEVGMDTVIFTTATCDSTVITTTTLLSGSETSLTATSCDPADVGTDTLTLMNQAGCDSLVITETTLSPADTTFVPATTCDPMSVGIDTMVFATNTCDSVVITTTTLLSGDETTLMATSCDPADVGTDTLTLMNQAGCDSLVITETTLSAADTTFVPATTCDPMSVGIDTMVFATNTCDSVVITTTSLLSGDETILMATSCDPAEVGMDTLFLMNQAGCDSLVITTTTLDPLPPTFLQATSCDPTAIGMDTVVFQTAMNCDSLVITTTTLVPGGDVVFQNETSCDPAEIGQDTMFLTNQMGCDSLVITDVTLSAADTSFQTAMTCDPAQLGLDTMVFNTATCDSIVITTTTLAMGDMTFLMATSCNLNDVGQDTTMLSNQAGCDSLVITETTFQGIPPTILQASSCDPMMVGVDTSIISVNGCDSMVITNTVLLPFSETLQSASSCDPADVGMDTLILVNSIGCDSLVITTTSLSPADTTFAQMTTCDAGQVGIDTIVFTTATCDSVVITTTTLLNEDIILQNAVTCDPADAGVDTLFLVNQAGCDSLVITTTTLGTIPPTIVNASSCLPSEVGVDTIVFSTATCDSMVITNTTLLMSDETSFELTSCMQSEVGVDTVILTNQNGCDSLIITNTVLAEGITNAEILPIDPSCLLPFGSISIDTVEGGEAPFLFSIDGGENFSTQPDFDQLEAGDYDIVIVDVNGCDFSASETLTGDVPSTISIMPEQITLPLGESVELSPTVVGTVATAVWTPQSALSCSDCLQPIASPTESTFYTIAIVDENGCTASTSVSILVDQRLRVYMPNAFSPNGDGFNDLFTVLGSEKQVRQVNEFLIFDRWGGKVFEQFNFDVNDFDKGWDGTQDGEDASLGVYVYLAFVTLENDEEIMIEGEVILIR